MLRRFVEVAAITALVALSAGIAAALGWGSARALPAIGGAAVVAGLIFFRRSASGSRALLALVLSALGAFAADWFVLQVLAHGYPKVSGFRSGPIYPALLVVLFAGIAALDVKATSASSAESARS